MLNPKKAILYSRHGAFITAINWGTLFFAAGVVAIYLSAKVRQSSGTVRLTGMATVGSLVLTSLIYLCLPTIDVTVVKGGRFRSINTMRSEQYSLLPALEGGKWRTPADARAEITHLLSDTNNGAKFW